MALQVNRRTALKAILLLPVAGSLSSKDAKAKEPTNKKTKPDSNQENKGEELSPLEFTALTVGSYIVVNGAIKIAEDICDENRAAKENARIEQFTNDYRRKLAMEDNHGNH